MHQRSMLDQPKTMWKCECGHDKFIILLCPECKGDDSHIVGFQCEKCEVIHVTQMGADSWSEDENAYH